MSAVTRCQVARVSGYPLAHHTVFFGEDYPDEFDSVFRRRTVTADPTVYVCAQDRSGEIEAVPGGSGLARGSGSDESSSGGERLFSLINAPARAHEADEIDAAASRMSKALSRHGLALEEEEGRTLTSPNDFAALFPATDGALYGRPTHGWAGSFSRPGSRSRPCAVSTSPAAACTPERGCRWRR